MADILRMPEVAANTPEAILSSWNVALDESYGAGDTIVTVETEKAIVDVEAEAEGILLRFLAEEGQTVGVGSPIAIWGSVGDSQAEVDALVSSLGLGQPAPTARVASDEPTTPPVLVKDRTFASPLARKLAREAALDLATIVGTGPGQRIRRRDVDAAITIAGAADPATTPGGQVSAAAPEQFEDIPVSRMRQTIARRLVESKQNAPHFYLRGSAHVDRLLALRRDLNDDNPLPVSLNDLVVKAVAVTHARVPGLNVQWNGDSIRHFNHSDVSIAVATDHGLVTPVVRRVDTMSVGDLAGLTRDLIQRAQSRALQQHELEGGSITVTNLGMFGTEEFAAIINPPQAAILAVGSASPQPLVVAGELQAGMVMRLSLAVDHRPVDGATGAEWMRALIDVLERPIQLLR